MVMRSLKKPGGRPRLREPQPGDRVPLSLRVTPEIKKRIDDASLRSGRSQSQEVEFRLERSCGQQGLLEEALTLRYGARLTTLLTTLADAMRGTIYEVHGLIDGEGHDFDEAQWLGDRRTYDVASKA